jgi:hypothetical protein
LRIFDGGTDSYSQGYGKYAIGSVHYENWKNISHVISDWDGAQQFVDDMFSPTYPFVGSKGRKLLQTSGEVSMGIAHDGVAAVIELL